MSAYYFTFCLTHCVSFYIYMPLSSFDKLPLRFVLAMSLTFFESSLDPPLSSESKPNSCHRKPFHAGLCTLCPSSWAWCTLLMQVLISSVRVLSRVDEIRMSLSWFLWSHNPAPLSAHYPACWFFGLTGAKWLWVNDTRCLWFSPRVTAHSPCFPIIFSYWFALGSCQF